VIKKSIVLVIILIIIIVFTSKVLDNNKKIDEEYYNQSLVISVQVFLRANTLPLKISVEELENIKLEISEFEKEYLMIKTNSKTKEGQIIMDSFFYEISSLVDICERSLTGDSSIQVSSIMAKLNEVQAIYLDFSNLIDDKKIVLSKETLEKISIATNDFLSNEN
jgi:hypothetical protein